MYISFFLCYGYIGNNNFTEIIQDNPCKDFLDDVFLFFECRQDTPAAYLSSRKEFSNTPAHFIDFFISSGENCPSGRFVIIHSLIYYLYRSYIIGRRVIMSLLGAWVYNILSVLFMFIFILLIAKFFLGMEYYKI